VTTAAAAYAFLGACVDKDLNEVPAQTLEVGAIGGDASKGVFCPGDTSATRTLRSSTSVYVLLDAVVLSVSVNGVQASIGASTAIPLATKLLATIRASRAP